MAPKINDLTGKTFAYLTVLGKHDFHNNQTRWLCVCDCGKKVLIYRSGLISGTIKSCGCYRKKYMSHKMKTHGLSKTPEYVAYYSMKSRCLNKKFHAYDRYGGRGIKICARWLKSFESFYADMGKKPGKKYSLDRIDNEEGYKPSNCRWATYNQQNSNRRILKSIL